MAQLFWNWGCITPLHYGRLEFESQLKDFSQSHPPLSPTSLPVYSTMSYHNNKKRMEELELIQQTVFPRNH